MDALDDRTDEFRFDYRPPAIRYGDGAVDALGEELERHGVTTAFVVAGRTTGREPAVIDPVRDGIAGALGDVFAETTPEKRLATVVAAVERYDELGADGIVALGGGSSLDVAKAVRALAASDDRAGAIETFGATGGLPVPPDLDPLVVVPTTLAGADLSVGAGLTAAAENGVVDRDVAGGLSAPQLIPDAGVYDPAIVATTPTGVLCASAMNGFDKGIESAYARAATPITDGTGARGVRLLQDALPTLRGDDPAYGRALRGTILVQYGTSRPDASTLALIHAFGHGLTAHSSIQQGAAHGVVAPHALEHVFAGTTAGRTLLADALETDPDGVVDAVAAVRDGLGLGAHLRETPDLDEDDLPAVAETTAEDHLIPNVPDGVDVSAAALEDVLWAAW